MVVISIKENGGCDWGGGCVGFWEASNVVSEAELVISLYH